MCGILGAYSLKGKKVSKTKIDEGLKSIRHRGPDYQNSISYCDDAVVLAHARLSIIDLSENGNQPMEIDDYRIVFNGEIYNYIEIREELVALGYEFHTESDTEVLVKAYDCWSEKCTSKFNGMWAFAILNVKTRKLFCSRDRFGVKPFNYFLDEEKFVFSSEIKGILAYDNSLRKPNYNSIGLFCREGICGEIEETWFQGVKRLMPGHNLTIQDGKVDIYKYYHYPEKIQKISFEEAKKEFRNIFLDAAKLRMRSDVPVGTTLSGGLDSSSIVSGVRTFFNGTHDTFTAHFPNFKDDELANADKTNKELNLTANTITIDYNNDYLEILNKIILHLESGHLSPSVFPIWKIYEKSTEKVTVLLEGQGADELLGGYINAFSGSFLVENLLKFKFKNFAKQAKMIHKNYNLKNTFVNTIRTYFPPSFREVLRRHVLKYEDVFDGELKKYAYPKKDKSKSESFFIRHLQDSHQTTLVNLLHYGDALSMAHALETRLPFVDYRLVDFCFSLPAEYLINDGKGKYILRESLRDILPAHIYDDKKKLGFPSPLDAFFKENKALIKELLINDKSMSRNLYNFEKLQKLIEGVGSGNYSERVVFRLVCVELWFRNFIDA